MQTELYKGCEIEIRTHGLVDNVAPIKIEILIFREFPGWIYRQLIQPKPGFPSDLDALKYGLQAARQVVDAM